MGGLRERKIEGEFLGGCPGPVAESSRGNERTTGRRGVFVFIYKTHLSIKFRTRYKKKPLQLIHLTMLFISITALIPNNKGVCCRRLAASTPSDPRGSGAAGGRGGKEGRKE